MKFVSTLGADDASTLIEQQLNIEGAKGWEVCGMQVDPEDIDDDCGIRFIMKRICKSVLEPFLSIGLSDEQLTAVYHVLTPHPRRPERTPLTVEDVNFFLEHARDIFDLNYLSLIGYHMDIDNHMDYAQAVENQRNDYK